MHCSTEPGASISISLLIGHVAVQPPFGDDRARLVVAADRLKQFSGERDL